MLDLDLATKHHLSVRWEQRPGIARVGVMLDDYTWEIRMRVIEMLLAFERAHGGDLALEFDILPLAAVQDGSFAEV